MGPVRQRAVLAVLALGRGLPVRRDALVDALWPQDPPPTAVNIVQGHVSELRRLLGGNGVLGWTGESYQLRLSAAELDVLAFDELARQAGTAARSGNAIGACGLYERALGLWHGEPAADVSALSRSPLVTALSAQRSAVVVAFAQVACEAGQGGRALGELRALAEREPLDERAHAWLMRALAGSQQRAAALEVFAACRARLDEQLGVEPGPELARARELALRDTGPDRAGAPGQWPAPGQAPGRVPRQLPRAVAGFVGRRQQLDTLSALLDQTAPGQTAPGQSAVAHDLAGTVVISAIRGMAGVGKTTLALRWAHQVASRFPDGQLYVNLRGFGPGGPPVDPADVLGDFLAALDVPAGRVPAEPATRAALYRTMLAGRRMLVMLDNARDSSQVLPLLPGSPGCLALVTSRGPLTALSAVQGVRHVPLEVLTEAESHQLLAARLGADRIAAEPGAAQEIVALAGGLPLALAIVAARVAASPAHRLAALAAELRDERGRLDALEGEELTADVRAAFSWSYRQLSDPAARMFRLLGLPPGPDIAVAAAASLTGTDRPRARRALTELAAAGLVNESAVGRYVTHDLLRAYATELSGAQDGADAGRAALTRLFDSYLSASAAAMDTLFPGERDIRPARVPAATVPQLTRPAAARTWLEAERPCLVAACAHMAEHGWPGYATRLARILFRYLDGGRPLDAIAVHSNAVRAARQAGDPAAELLALTDLVLVDVSLGRNRQAVTGLEQALHLYREAADQAGEGRVLGNLGMVNMFLGHYPRAIDQSQQALVMYRQAGDRARQPRALHTLGRIYTRQGCYQRAEACLREALELCGGPDDQNERAYVHTYLAQLRLRQGDLQQAAGHAHQALEMFREVGSASGAAYARLALGRVDLGRGRYQQAASQLRAVLTVCQDTAERNDEAETLTALAEAERGLSELGLGDIGQARRLVDEALALFRDTGDRSGEAAALNVLGEVELAAGQPADARARHAEALALASGIGDQPEQARARRGLTVARPA
jgi:DNA-binding SARP family transcriptional activator/tetratricopeptide (TPR) repeat protein